MILDRYNFRLGDIVVKPKLKITTCSDHDDNLQTTKILNLMVDLITQNRN